MLVTLAPDPSPDAIIDVDETDGRSAARRNRTRTIRRAITLLTVGAAASFFWTKRSDIPATWRALRGASPVWIAGALCLAALAMLNQMLLHRASQHAVGVRIPTRDLWRTTNAAYFINAVAKSGGLAGVVAFTATSGRHRQARSTTVAAYLVVTVLVQLGFAASLLAALMVLNSGGRLTSTEVIASVVFGAYTLVLTGSIAAAFCSQSALRTIHALPARLVGIVRRNRAGVVLDHAAADALFDALQALRRSPRSLTRTAAHALAAQVIAIAMLWTTLHAVGADVGPAVAIVAYSVAIMFLIVSILPGGVGLVEASLAIVLAGYGLPVGTVAAAVVIYRVLELWVPFTVGAVDAHRLRPAAPISR